MYKIKQFSIYKYKIINLNPINNFLRDYLDKNNYNYIKNKDFFSINTITSIKAKKESKELLNERLDNVKTGLRRYYPSYSLSLGTLKDFSLLKKETKFFLDFRLKGLEYFYTCEFPNWTEVSISDISWEKMFFQQEIYLKDLWVKEKEIKLLLQKNKKDHKMYTTEYIQNNDVLFISDEDWARIQGVLFSSIRIANDNFPNLIEEHFGTVIEAEDNYSAALNAIVFSDGSFVYALQDVICDFEVTTFFRLDDEHINQFERTFILTEENASIEYFEGCNSMNDFSIKNHAAAVELKSLKNSQIIYTTLQDWFYPIKAINGGVNNMVTKRGLCAEENSTIHWTQIELGSSITYKYPSCILLGKNSYGDFYSITYAENSQQTDTGSKIIHIGEGSNSSIVSKSIQRNQTETSVRTLVNHLNKNCSTYSQCDTLIYPNNCISNTYPTFNVSNLSQIEHEASLLRLSEEKIFYFYHRGIPKIDVIPLITNGFCHDVYMRLPPFMAEEVKFYLGKKLKKAIKEKL